MNKPRLLSTIYLLFASFWISATLVGCGSGQELETTNGLATGNASTAGNGSVSFVVTDAPSEDFDHIYLTITSVQLLGKDKDNKEVVFSGEQKIDLLMLENFTDFFAISDDIPAGTYSKIRLYVSEVELIKLDQNGNILEAHQPKLPGKGKIDLNPRGEFTVNSGELLTVELDFDAKKSIHIHGKGKNRYHFRPVIFVNVVGHSDSNKLLRVSGLVNRIDSDAETLLVCSASYTSDELTETDIPTSHCFNIRSSNQLGIFDESAMPINFNELAENDEVLVIGHYDHDGDQMFGVIAEVIQQGGVGTSRRFKGVVASDYDADNMLFDFMLDAKQGFASETQVGVSLSELTAVFDSNGMRVDVSAITDEASGQVEGVLNISNEQDDLINAIAVVLKTNPLDGDSIKGSILVVDSTSSQLTVDASTGDRCVSVGENIDIIVIDENDGLESNLISFSELQLNDRVQAFGQEDSVNGCFNATTLIIDHTSLAE
jgi:hypothetical protein